MRSLGQELAPEQGLVQEQKIVQEQEIVQEQGIAQEQRFPNLMLLLDPKVLLLDRCRLLGLLWAQESGQGC
ncbi:MAG: hypothetical protein AAEC03_04645 [Synechococcus sp.]